VVVSVRVPDVPVMVTVDVPLVAVELAVKVSVLLAVAGLGTKVAITPLGNPEADRVTLPLKPFDGVIMMALVPVVPCTTVRLLGLAERANVGDALTVSVIVVVSVRLPDVPVTITVAAPVFAVALAVKVNTLVDVAGFGLKAAVTPLGKPDAEKVTLEENPFAGVIVIVLVAVVPCTIGTLLGLADRENVGSGATVKVMAVV
jgi:hypothetical protein